MKDKVVLITGSSSGIGEAVAFRFAKLGCRLVIHGTNKERLTSVGARCLELSPYQYKPLEILANFTDTKSACRQLIDEVTRIHGQLDVLVNNAGLYRPIDVNDPNAYDLYNETMKLNMDSAVYLSLLAAPLLRKTKGNIVNVSSNLSSKCIGGAFAYSSAKAALSMFSKSLAVELAPDVRVNCVSPGPVATAMPSRCGMDLAQFKELVGPACLVERVGEPDEIARLIEFIASSESAFITGSDYLIDGGGSIKPAGKVMGQS